MIKRKKPKGKKRRITYNAVNPLKADPTRTQGLRNRFAIELRKRFRRIKGELLKLVVDEDAFGLRPVTNTQTPTTNASRWRFRTSAQKTQDFLAWLRSQLNQQFLGIDDQAVWEQYVQQGFRQGAGRSFDDFKRMMGRSGRGGQLQRPMGFYQGTREEFLRLAFRRPVSLEKVQLLTSRVFTDIQGVTDYLATKMTRTLADGLTQGVSPLSLVKSLADDLDIGENRAETIARTEIVRAHAEGQLEALEDLGVEEVGVTVEWDTAGDYKVCPLCAPLQGVVLKLSEAKGMIPRHPSCRCAWIPAGLGEDDSEQKTTKGQIKAAISSSQGRVKDGDKKWGPATAISKDRPASLITNELLEFSRFLISKN